MALKHLLQLTCIVAFLTALVALGVKKRCNKLLEDDLSIYSDRSKNPMQDSIEFKNVSPEELRKAAVEVCFSIKGLCKRQKHKPCKAKDVRWLSRLIATGDNDCNFLCGKEKFEANLKNLPSDTAFGLAVWYVKEMKKTMGSTNDIKASIETGGELEEPDPSKRAVFTVLGTVILGIAINLGSMAAVGYITNNPNADKFAQGVGEVTNLASLGVGCFDAGGSVVVQRNGGLVTKSLGQLKEGEFVQAVNDAGDIEFSQVYYIAHARDKIYSKLLSIQYQDGGKSQAIGLSNRHLIYASKSSENGTVGETIMAADLNVGDKIFTMGDNNLQERTVTAIIPYIGRVVHPLTYNHHIIVNNVHASVHILNENLYRFLTKPLQWVCWMYPECGESQLVHNLIRFVEDTKEPFAMMRMGETPSFLKQLAGMSMLSGFKSEL